MLKIIVIIILFNNLFIINNQMNEETESITIVKVKDPTFFPFMVIIYLLF